MQKDIVKVVDDLPMWIGPPDTDEQRGTLASPNQLAGSPAMKRKARMPPRTNMACRLQLIAEQRPKTLSLVLPPG